MSESSPIFRREYKDYTRNFDYVGQWINQNITYAKIQDPNIDVEQYTRFLKDNIKRNGLFPLHDPQMSMIIKDENNDRQKGVLSMMNYLKQVVTQDLRFAPTFTTYRPEYQMRSVEASFLDVGMANRSKEKKAKFAAKERGDDYMVNYHDNMQKMLKILNNSSSGAKGTAGTILYNQTGHSTLTSICRSTTSFSNSINEKLLGGYRHYYNQDVTINNILAVLTYGELNVVEQVMEKYNLHYVTEEEFIEYIKRSTDVYWKSTYAFNQILEVASKLTPLQRSAYLYNGDFYALRKFNPQFVRTWLSELLNYDNLEPLPQEEAEKWISLMDDDLAAVVVIYASGISLPGKGIRTSLKEAPEITPMVGAIVKNTIETYEKYRDLIQIFYVSDIMPFETAFVPNMMRGVVLGSDTDSSLFTLEEWIDWFTGEIVHNDRTRALVATLVYITSQHIAHILGMMTGILNIVESKRHLIAMKNEFLFSSFTTTPRGKHYYAKKDAQEGIMIPSEKMETEIKGVGFKHSKVPAQITNDFRDELYGVMNTIERDEKYSILELRRRIAMLENDVYESIRRGEPLYLQRGQVKVKEAYKDENSIYKKGYLLWEDVFAPKYGHTVEPPYDCIKVSLSTDTKTRFNAWINTFTDQQLAQRLRDWVDQYNEGRPLKTFYIPQAVATSTGMPEEFMNALMPRKLVFTIVAPYYLMMESFNVLEANKQVTRLCSDDFEDLRIPESIFDTGTDNEDE